MRLPLEPSPYILLGMLGMLGLACSNASPRSEPGAPALLVMQAPPPSSAASEVPSPAAPERVSVELFVMSRCPFGTRAEQSWAEAVRRLGNVDLRISFVGTVGPNGELRSMRGPSELTGDAAQICAMKHSHQWLAMIDCQNRSPSDIDFNWRECAADLAMPLEDIEACTFGTEAKTLLAQSFEYGISRGVKASPTIFIADREYKGGRSARELIAAVCEASTVKPAVCSTLATTPEVPVTALFDKRCTGCDIPRADGDPLAAVLNPRLTTLDYQTPEGRTLFDTVQPKGSPFYVFGPELDGDPLGLALVEGRLDTTTERRVLVDGTWNPRCADPGGCAHPVCKLSPPCRREQPRRVDLYLEDSSPLSNLALRALDQVVQSFDRKKSTLTFAVHQIATNPRRGAATFSEAELAEPRRRLCVQNPRPGKPSLAYLACRAASPDGDWRDCTGDKTGLDAAAIGKCVGGPEGARLYAASQKHAHESDVMSGATFVINGRTKLRTVHTDALKQAICGQNAKLAGCDETLGSLLVK